MNFNFSDHFLIWSINYTVSPGATFTSISSYYVFDSFHVRNFKAYKEIPNYLSYLPYSISPDYYPILPCNFIDTGKDKRILQGR